MKLHFNLILRPDSFHFSCPFFLQTLSPFSSAFLCSGCSNEMPRTMWLTNNRSLFQRVLEAGSPRSRHWQTRRLVGSASQATDKFPLLFPHVVEGAWVLWGAARGPVASAQSSQEAVREGIRLHSRATLGLQMLVKHQVSETELPLHELLRPRLSGHQRP